MKLNKIHIDNYKNLAHDFSFEQADKYIALIGLNGSGKSNVLESISFLFSQAMGITFPFPIAHYNLTYDIRNHSVVIDESKFLENGAIVPDDLPSSVIACYSGEDNRLWNSGFKNFYVKFFNDAISGGEYKPQVLYVNKYCWKIAFLSLLFSENDEVKQFISDKLKINADSVTINFKTKAGGNPQQNDASNWYQRVIAKYNEKAISINDLKGDEDILLSCEKYPSLTDDQIIFYYLYFLHIPDKNGTYGLQADKLIESIDISLNGYSFNDLSEGEKKLILIECIIKVLGDEHSLVLLDEPDAHTHIAMKKDILKLISEFEGQTIMTTHSPMFLNKRWNGYNEKNVFYMNEGKIEDPEPLKHLSELTDNEVDYFEGTFILSSKNILVTEGTYDGLYLNKAISIFEKENVKYSKLRDITIVYSGGTGNAFTFYEQILKDTSDLHDRIVYLFDYDKAGLTGWKAINEIADPKVTPIFYQEDYSVVLDTNMQNNNIAPKDTIMVEDLFAPQSYEPKVKVVHDMNTHREFRCNTQGKTTDAIKSFIEKNYNSFEDEWLVGFKPTLDKLIELFNL